MADSQDERKRIAGELARRRAELTDQSLLLRRDFDIGHRMSDSLRKHSWGWMSIAAMFGWLLSRLPARKKKIYIHSANSEKWRAPQGKSHGSDLEGRVVDRQTAGGGLRHQANRRKGQDPRSQMALKSGVRSQKSGVRIKPSYLPPCFFRFQTTTLVRVEAIIETEYRERGSAQKCRAGSAPYSES